MKYLIIILALLIFNNCSETISPESEYDYSLTIEYYGECEPVLVTLNDLCKGYIKAEEKKIYEARLGLNILYLDDKMIIFKTTTDKRNYLHAFACWNEVSYDGTGIDL